MPEALQTELEKIKRDLLYVGSMVREGIEKSVVSFYDSRSELAQEVLTEDDQIDRKEVEIEERCLDILSLYRPGGEDLRFLAVVMKINNDLERMGDNAVSISRRSLHYLKRTPMDVPSELRQMADQSIEMMQSSLRAFVHKDIKLAESVRRQDEKVDELQNTIFGKLKARMRENTDLISVALDVFTITRRLERIADLATNISEEVIYMVEGEIVRHSSK